MTLLNKKAILAAKTPKHKTLHIAELGGDIGIKVMSAGEREALEQSMSEQKDKHGIRASVFVHSVCDQDGKLIFDDNDLEAVKNLPASVVMRVFDAANELNEVKDIEDTKKN